MSDTHTVADGIYSLRVPCRRCPFRVDVAPYIRAERAQEIAHALRSGSDFPCHKTTAPAEDEDGEGRMARTVDSKMCVGATATMEREGRPNQLLRIAETLGMYDPRRVDEAKGYVHPSLSAWVRSFYTIPTVTDPHSGDVLEFEHCGVVGDDCEDPAGYGGSGGAYGNDAEPTCNPLESCHACGNPMCTACRGDDTDDGFPECVECARWDDGDDA